MKLFHAAIILLLVLPLSTALTTDLRESYRPGETIIVELSGPVMEPIAKSQVVFLRGHVQTVFDYDIKRLGESYFLYAIASSIENNYTLEINDVLTTVNGQQQVIDYKKNFSVSGQYAAYTIKPGFISTQTNFEISVFLNEDNQRTIPVGLSNSTTRTLKPGDNQLSFSISDFTMGLNDLIIGDYTLPVYAIISDQPIKTSKVIYFVPSDLHEVFVYGSYRPITFQLRNTGLSDLEDFKLDYDSEKYTLTPKSLSKLKVNETASFNITLKQNQTIQSTIKISSGNESIEIPFSVTFTQNSSALNNTTSNVTQGYYCSELNGKLCQASEVCVGQTRSALDGSCCIGACNLPEEESSSWIGYLLGAVILIILVIVGGRYWKAKGLKNPFAKRVELAEKKFYFF